MRCLQIILLCILIFSCREEGTKTNNNNKRIYYQTVIPKDTIVTMGDTFHAKIYLTDYPANLVKSITVDSINGHSTGTIKLPIKNGIGIFNYVPSEEDTNVFIGRIIVKETDSSKWDIYFFRSTFEVKKPKTQ